MPGFYSPSSDGIINWPSKETSVYYATLLGAYYGANALSDWLQGSDKVPQWFGDYSGYVYGGASMLLMAMVMHYLVYNVIYAQESIL